MSSSHPTNEQHRWLKELVSHAQPSDWEEISDLLTHIQERNLPPSVQVGDDYLRTFARGTAFITFGYGIDGVTIEIAKYAQTLEDIYRPLKTSAIYLMGEHFARETEAIFQPAWQRVHLDGIDGWGKWGDGAWFDALFRKTLISRSEESRRLAAEIFRQAVSIAERLEQFLLEHQIALLIPVNIASNPGNLAATLGLIMAAEALGTYALNINHDFYWEGGKSLNERTPDEVPGVRDHFFKNILNRSFFGLFRRLYPWNGRRWLQVNINARQSRKLIQKHHFPRDKVFEISTCVNERFFEPYDQVDILDCRTRMGRILSNGEPLIHPVDVREHIAALHYWMNEQRPCVVGARPGLSIDPRSEGLLILLQPTRVIGRKRIARNLALIEALLTRSRLREEFENRPGRQLILHITGPAPKEHQADLLNVLQSYKNIIQALPAKIAERIFLAFSVGQESHPSFSRLGFEPLTIEDIYRLADVVVFPSETEGRGLPIIEASASGIPIICSRYSPREVFEEVVGEHLPESLRIHYIRFPEKFFNPAFLSEVSDLLLNPGSPPLYSQHNRAAVRARYSRETFQQRFEELLRRLYRLDQRAD